MKQSQTPQPTPVELTPSTRQNHAEGFQHFADILTRDLNRFAYQQGDPELRPLYLRYWQSIGNWRNLAYKHLADCPAIPELPDYRPDDAYAGLGDLLKYCQAAARRLLGKTAGGDGGAYDADAYMAVKEAREHMDPPLDCNQWTRLKEANPWLRFDPKAPANRPRVHRADAAKLARGTLDPDTFGLLDIPGSDLPSLLTTDYLADAAARKAEIDRARRRRESAGD